MTAMHQIKFEEINNIAPESACITRLSPQTVNCQVCDPTGGCLAHNMLKNHRHPDRTLKSNRGIKSGEHVFREGDIFNALNVVRSGSVKSYLISNDGEEQVLGFYLPGDVFGLDGSEEHGRMSSAVTLETSTVCRLPIEDLDETSITKQLLKLTSSQLLRDHNLILMLRPGCCPGQRSDRAV